MLTDAESKNSVCSPDKKWERLACSGSLYLEVSPNGLKRWFWKYRKDRKKGCMALGSYPEVGPKQDRAARDAAKAHKADGVDPVQARRSEKLKSTRNDGDTFKVIAMEWYGKQAPQWSSSHAGRMLRQIGSSVGHWKLQTVPRRLRGKSGTIGFPRWVFSSATSQKA